MHSFEGKKASTDYSAPNYPPWKHAHTSNITQTAQVALMHLGIYMYLKIKEAMNLIVSKREHGKI